MSDNKNNNDRWRDSPDARIASTDEEDTFKDTRRPVDADLETLHGFHIISGDNGTPIKSR